MPIASTLVRSIDPITAISTLFALLSSLLFYKAYLLPNFLSPLRHIPGPPNKSKYNKYNLPFLGNFPDIIKEEAGIPHRQWIEQYGGIVCYRGLFNNRRILLADPKAIQHVFSTNSYKYPKPSNLVRLLGKVIGHGVLLAEGDVHRKQRKMLNPAFSHKHIKDMVHIMAGPAETLGRQWEEHVERSGEKPFELDITADLGSCTLDIIGLSGFGYDFQAMTNPDNEMSLAYRELFYKETTSTQFLRVFIPYYADLPTQANLDRKKAIETIDRVTMRIINEKRALANAKNHDEDDSSKDLMSILIRGNEQVGSLEDGKLTDTELKDQIMTFLAAGHETTSVTVTWMLHVFSIYPEVQRKVRQEMLQYIGRPTDANRCPLTYDTLNTLPYLSACVKELLRFIPPVPTTSRVAAEDDTILGYDIPKGTQVFLSPAALHKLKSVFGEDAEEFKPERWMDPSTLTEEQRQSTKFVTSEMSWAYVPFLTGPRNCIGSKFATMETKIILYYLLINLEYAPVPGFKFKKASRITWRPFPGMRLIVKRFSESEGGDATLVEP
ncbi:MAG: cytochrome P450 [Linnemannia elongata]|nr:MAG: cytochrome P450 [Linnemannia elongata]